MTALQKPFYREAREENDACTALRMQCRREVL
jgi:hypothetical protein